MILKAKSFNPKRTGGAESTFRAIISRKFFLRLFSDVSRENNALLKKMDENPFKSINSMLLL